MTKDSYFFPEAAVSNTNSHPLTEDLARYIDGLRTDMSVKFPAQFVEHVENCQFCQAQILDVFFYLRDPLREPDTASAIKIFPAKKHRPIWLFPAMKIVAAAFVFILLMTLYLFLPRHQTPDSYAGTKPEAPLPLDIAAHSLTVPTQVPAQKPRSSEAVRQDAPVVKKGNGRRVEQGDAFAINRNLESMVGSRSRGFIIEVYSPPNHITLSREITFSWKEFSREPLSLAIVNNRNETVFKNPVNKSVFLFRAALPSGCYYWKLESATELYYVGKFFVDTKSTSPKE